MTSKLPHLQLCLEAEKYHIQVESTKEVTRGYDGRKGGLKRGWITGTKTTLTWCLLSSFFFCLLNWSHASRNDVSVSDRPHIQRCCCKILFPPDTLVCVKLGTLKLAQRWNTYQHDSVSMLFCSTGLHAVFWERRLSTLSATHDIACI